MGKRREAQLKLTRWQYFTKNLYNNTATKTRFSYDKVVYLKSEELMDIESRSSRINVLLLLALVVRFLLTSRIHNVWIVIAYLVLVVAGQIVRLCMLPKDIQAHLTDSGYRDR